MQSALHEQANTPRWPRHGAGPTTGGHASSDSDSRDMFTVDGAGRRRYRTWLLAGGVTSVALTLPAVAGHADVWWPGVALWAAGAAGLLWISPRRRRLEQAFVRYGAFVVVGLILLLELSTGGAGSPYGVLYVPLLGFMAAFCDTRAFLTVLAASVLAAVLPDLLDLETTRLVVQLLAAGAVGGTLAVMHRIATSLRDANELYLSVLDKPGGPAYLLTPDAGFRWVNGRGQELLGMSQEEVAGTPWPAVVADGETERLMPDFHAALEGEARPITVTTDAPGGSYRLRGTILPVRRDGQVEAVMGITEDVTELHAAAFGASALRQILNSLATPVAIFEAASGTTLYANTASQELVRRDADGAEGVRWEALLPSLTDDPPGPGETRTMTIDSTVDGARRQFDVLVEGFEGEPDLLVYTGVDTTDRARREQHLADTITFERESSERLRELDRLKHSVLTAVSHELRTPVTVILGTAKSLQRLRDAASPSTRHQLEDALTRQAERLAGLLADLLDLDRLTRGLGRAAVEEVDLATLVRQLAVQHVQHELIDVEAPAQLTVPADRVQIGRIVGSLLDNAAKYAPGPVEVRLEGLGDRGFRLQVTDDGPGIPEEDLERVFEPFHRLDLEHPQPGTGIGLTLVAELAAIHGGRAWAERVRPDGGTRITVEFPACRMVAGADG